MAGDHSISIEHIEKSAHAKSRGLSSNIRRVMAIFFLLKGFCAYDWPYPSYLASPVPVNLSKVILLIINYIQNMWFIAPCAENIISGNITCEFNVVCKCSKTKKRKNTF